jgi:pyridoxamine 5'-phosphate oxidase
VPDPIAEFCDLFARAKEAESGDATAMALATCGADGRPSVRMVLLKGADAAGFVFYTNLGSRKARDLAAQPHAALCFHWPTLVRQVRVEGAVEPVGEEEADAYFATRARGSQIGAWASRQSEPLPSRVRLLRRYLESQIRYAGQQVPRPPFWSGFRLRPERIEFWSGERYRLHDRRLYVRTVSGWDLERLYP